MKTAKEHYDQQLASVYSWMAGSPEDALERNRGLFRQLQINTELLAELQDRANSLSIRTIHDDILNFSKHIDEQARVVVCMGDTHTHLESIINPLG